jgi:hypothetical protein
MVCKNFLHNLKNIRQIEVKIDSGLKHLIENKENKLIYGCGTTCDYLLSCCNFNNVTLTSGLKEEYGVVFHRLKVCDIRKINLTSYKYILNTATGYEKEVREKYFKQHSILTLKKHQTRSTITITTV